MALLKILHYPDERLRVKAKPVERVDGALRRLIDDMFETMYAAPGIGLAASQVDVHLRLIVMDISEERLEPRCFINPELIHTEGEIKMEEGCLSVPNTYEDVKRFERVRVRAQDRDGNWFELDAEGLLSVCIQHEMDHLEGKLFVDYLSEMKRTRIRKRIAKQARETL